MLKIAQALIILTVGIQAIRVHSVSEDEDVAEAVALAETETETDNKFDFDSLAKLAKDKLKKAGGDKLLKIVG